MRLNLKAPVRPPVLALALIAALGIVVTNLLDAPAALHENVLVGSLQLLQVLAFPVLAVLWLRGRARWPWVLAGVLSLQAIGGIVASRTVGLSGQAPDIGNWTEPLTLITLGSYVLMALMVGLRFFNWAPEHR